MTRIWYTDEGAAEALSMSRSKVRELIDTGEIDSFKVGTMRRISHDALTDYARRAETAARAASSPVPARAVSAVTR